MSLVWALLGLGLVMSAAWVCQRLTRNIGWVDVFWTLGTAVAGVGLAFAWSGPDTSATRRLLVCLIAGIWALRLGLAVAVRVARSDEDGRYGELREDWGSSLQPRLFGFLQLQAVVALVLAVAIALAANRAAPALDLQDVVGVLIALIAISGEATADRQLKAFAGEPGGRNRICDRGLWAWSRHPNYVFEWLGWLAYPVIAIDLTGDARGWWALSAPVVMFAVLRFGTGVPPLEAHMARTRGDAWRAYCARVPIFFPRPPVTQEGRTS
jgi:steroid 5-alpha reductase family enzyme